MTVVNEQWIKEAQAGLDAAVEKIAQEVQPGIDPNFGEGGLGAGLSRWWNSLSDDTKNIIKNTLIGGAAGAGIMGTAGAVMADPEDRWSEALKKALIGGAGGALAAGTGTAGYNLLTGGRQRPGEVEGAPSIVDAGADELADKFFDRPLTYAGLAGGAGLGAYYGAGAKEIEDAALSGIGTRQIAHPIQPVGAGMQGGPPPVMIGEQQLVRDQLDETIQRLKDSPNWFKKLQGYLPGAKQRAIRLAGSGAPEDMVRRSLAELPPTMSKGKYAALLAALLGGLGYVGDRVVRGDT